MKKYITIALLFPGFSLANTTNWGDFMIAHTFMKETQGVIFFKQDIDKNNNIICEEIKNSKRLSMVDQESESIYRINREKAIPPAYNTTLDYAQFYNKVLMAARELRNQCVKVNLAPVADLQKGDRVYSQDYEKNKKYVNLFAEAMRNEGVIPTYKHYPGLNKTKSVYGTPYEKYYKNIYGEGVIDISTKKEMLKKMQIFQNNKKSDVLMFSVATYPHIDSKPIIFNEEMWDKAYELQENSIYIPDDLSELYLSDQEIVYLFKKFDLLMFTNPNDVRRVYKVLGSAKEKGMIEDQEIEDKKKRIINWKKRNNLSE